MMVLRECEVYQRLLPLRIGQTITQMFQSDMAVEIEAVDRLRRGIEYMRSVSDITSARLFESILADEEEHIDYLETQLGPVMRRICLAECSASRAATTSSARSALI